MRTHPHKGNKNELEIRWKKTGNEKARVKSRVTLSDFAEQRTKHVFEEKRSEWMQKSIFFFRKKTTSKTPTLIAYL